MAQSEKPNLIILDLVLPKLHGFEVLKGLKTSNIARDIPVIVLTNMGDLENIEKALELGATTYMIKADYTLEDVVAKVKAAIAA